MKRFFPSILAVMLVFSFAVISVPPQVFAAGENACPGTPLDGAWDWFTTLGKKGLEKDRVLLENNAERAKRCAEKIAKQAQKDAGNAAADAKKKLGF